MSPQTAVICGIKNSGKTTLMTKLIKSLTKRGYRVSAIKHDGHDFTPDVPGTDSFRMREAGACGTAVFSDHRFLVCKETEQIRAEQLMELFSDSDIILMEGFKHTQYPKLEIVRCGIADTPCSNPEGLKAILTDIPGYHSGQYPVLDLNDTERIAEFLLEQVFGI